MSNESTATAELGAAPTPPGGDDPFGSPSRGLLSKPPKGAVRIVSLAVCAMLAVSLVYACFASIDIVVSAQGHVIPPGRSKIVQPFEAGIIKDIRVRDGQRVRAGDLLVALDSTLSRADQERIQRELWEAQADVLRLDAVLAGHGTVGVGDGIPDEIGRQQALMLSSRMAEQRARIAALDADIARREADGDAIAANISQLAHSLPLVQRKLEMRTDLAKTGHIAETGVIEVQLELFSLEKEEAIQKNRLKEARAGLASAKEQRAQAQADFRAKAAIELVEATRRRESAKQEFVKVSQKSELQQLRSPIDGVVQQLAVTTIGGVVTPAQALLTVVPDDAALEVEAQVLNRDIGHVKVGQRVINKLETFDFTRFGYIEGTVLWVGTDAVNDQKLGPVYPVRIELASARTPLSVAGNPGTVSAGMTVTSDIRTGERRLIEYFLAPLLRYKQEALRER